MKEIEKKIVKVGHTDQQNFLTCAFEISEFWRYNNFAQKNQASTTDTCRFYKIHDK